MLKRLRFSLMYLGKPPWDSGISPPELMSFIASHTPGRALDLGCGTGTNIITLVQHGWQVTGIDFAPTAVRLARKKLAKTGLQADIRQGDVSKLEMLPGPFDLILDIGCLHSLSRGSRLAALEHIQRLMDPNGTYLSYTFVIPEGEQDRPGITEADILDLSSKFILSQRADGADSHGMRQSAWLSMQSRS